MDNNNNLRLLANLPIYVDKIPIYSPTLKNIAQLGNDNYLSSFSYCTVTKETINETLYIDTPDNFDLVIRLCDQHGLFYSFLFGLKFFTKENFTLDIKNDDIVFTVENSDIELNRNNYESFVKAIKQANGISVQDIEELDEFDKQIAQMEKKIQESQSQNQPKIDFEDLISSVANMDGNGLNIINIWDLNIYQFYDQLKRGKKKEDYFMAIKQVLAGCKSDDIKIEHYIQSLK